MRNYISDSSYRSIMQKLFFLNENRMQSKSSLTVWFMCFLDSTWSCDELFTMMECSEKFSPVVILMDILDNETNHRNKTFFDGKGIPYIDIKDIQKDHKEPDLVMYPTMYSQYVKGVNVGERSLSCLVFSIPYTFWCDTASDHLLDNENASVLWRFYAPTNMHKEMGVGRNIIGNFNMRFSGYPKLDDFLEKHRQDIKKKKKTIIYAPGMFSGCESNNFATFDKNGTQILELARETADFINWIYRPHPQLGESLEANEILTNENYNNYVDCWQHIPNAVVSKGGSYRDIFMFSDAMITDAISFVSVYQYIHKPLLYLDKDIKPELNKYGEILHKVVYHAAASDFLKIRKFVFHTVMAEMDNLKDVRENFFMKNLDYVSRNGLSASKYIYEDIYQSIYKEDKK